MGKGERRVRLPFTSPTRPRVAATTRRPGASMKLELRQVEHEMALAPVDQRVQGTAKVRRRDQVDLAPDGQHRLTVDDADVDAELARHGRVNRAIHAQRRK